MATNLITPVSVVPFKRIYPHLDEVKDWPTNQTARLLWDRIHDLEGRLKAAEATITRLVSGVNTVDQNVAAAASQAQTAFMLAQDPGSGLVPPGGEWTPMAPNRIDIVEAEKAAHPTEWWNAHRDGLTQAEQEAFIRLLALALYAIDPRFGLNGKRGTTTISQDAIAYLNATVSFGCETIDVIADAGGASPQPSWNNVTQVGGGAVGALWIDPTL